jgi:DNA invertase Pin-like site-specific DNA recombinase
MNMKKIAAIYVRVSTSAQDIKSQVPDLERWIEAQGEDIEPVQWFVDKHTGKTMDRPQWNKLQSLIDANKVKRLVCWRLDRLGRTASGLTKLFEELQARKILFESIKDKIDLSTSSGRLMANVLASVASFETELRAERVLAGQAAARASGKKWGGSRKGQLHKITMEQVRQIAQMKQDGKGIVEISRTVSIDRPGCYRILERVASGAIQI